MSNEVGAARAALELCGASGTRLAASLDDLMWRAKPSRGGWSPAQCFTHLNLTTASMLPLLQAGVEEARAKGWRTSGTLTRGLLPHLLCWFLEPPYRIKGATQPAFVPGAESVKSDVMREWDAGHRALDGLIADAAGLALDRPKIVSPFDPKGKVRYSVYDALLIVAAHERRHLWQARAGAGAEARVNLRIVATSSPLAV